MSGTEATVGDLVKGALDEAISAAQAHRAGSVAVLDAGCGRASPLKPFRARIARFVGADIHAPSEPLEYLDEFLAVDLCASTEPFEPGTFDVILMNFTLEHFDDPAIVLAHLRRALRPGGRLVATTVNRRHPFVRAYLGLPAVLRGRAQRWVKLDPGRRPPAGRGLQRPSDDPADAARGGLRRRPTPHRQPPEAGLGTTPSHPLDRPDRRRPRRRQSRATLDDRRGCLGARGDGARLMHGTSARRGPSGGAVDA